MAATMGFPAARIFWKVAWPLRHTVGWGKGKGKGCVCGPQEDRSRRLVGLPRSVGRPMLCYVARHASDPPSLSVAKSSTVSMKRMSAPAMKLSGLAEMSTAAFTFGSFATVPCRVAVTFG